MQKMGRGRDESDSVLAAISVPQVSEHTSRTEWEKAAWRVFVTYLVAAEQPEELVSVLNVIITPRERRTIIQRLAAANRILSGRSYQSIGEELWLSPQTISGLKKAIREEQYRSYRERSKTKRKKRAFSRTPRSSKRRFDASRRRVRTKFGTIYI